MFLESSRYFQCPQVNVMTPAGSTVRAVCLRRLPTVLGELTVVKGHDRLDIMAQRQYDDATRFWHIADANAELAANTLVQQTLRTIYVPKQ